MSATYGWLRGYSKSGAPKQKEAATASGPASIWAKVGTWRTFAEATVDADGSGSLIVRRGSKVIFAATFGPEGGLGTSDIITIRNAAATVEYKR